MGTDILFTRIAVTPEQIAASSLPTRPTTASDTRSRIRAEAAAVWIGRHRACHAAGIVQDAIERHTPAKAYARLMKPRQAKLWRR
jgi:hypothetical protein